MRVWGRLPSTHLAWEVRKNVVFKLLRSIFQNHSVLYSVSRYVGCVTTQGPRPICRVTANLHGCWSFPFSGHQQVHFLGEGTSGQSTLDTETLQCLWGGFQLDGPSTIVSMFWNVTVGPKD